MAPNKKLPQLIDLSLNLFQKNKYKKEQGQINPKKILLLSPHPDDECIQSSLGLRYLEQHKGIILNLCVTLGSDKKRQAARKKELAKASKKIGFDSIILPEDWKKKEIELKEIIQIFKPDLIICPHEDDLHPTHVKTHQLLKKVLKKEKKNSCLIAWSEFWFPIKNANLLIEVSVTTLQTQIEALIFHKGEVKRNPYHLRLPAWMMDNVRRGSELVSDYGSKSASFPFGTLYRIEKYHHGKWIMAKKPIVCPLDKSLAQIFESNF